MWQAIVAWLKKTCLRSLTIAWAYVVAFASLLMQFIDVSANFFNDPVLKDEIHAVMGDTVFWGYILLFISVMTILCRLRSIRNMVQQANP